MANSELTTSSNSVRQESLNQGVFNFSEALNMLDRNQVFSATIEKVRVL